MKKVTFILFVLVVFLFGFIFITNNQKPQGTSPDGVKASIVSPEEKPEIEPPVPKLVSAEIAVEKKEIKSPLVVQPIPNYLTKSIEWLADAQMPNGGWGAGQNTRQDIRDPKAVNTDPATTAFSAIALARSGSTLQEGVYKNHLQKALDYLLECVESTPGNTFNITDQTGTQPQRKLGENIDVSMAIQFFGKILHDGINDETLKQRVNYAMDRCIGMLEETQQKDGSWSKSGWAPVLNSVMANNALELSRTVGKNVDIMLDQSMGYQKGNLDTKSGAIKTDKSAGIALYSISSTQRATAKECNEAVAVFNELRKDGEKTAEPQTEEEAYDLLNKKLPEEKARQLASSYRANISAKKQMGNDDILNGFGNKGGEEFLSYMMTSESYVADGDQKTWDDWHKKMSGLFEKIQNGNGTWTGQHCITSPVFCTAAVIMTVTADRDADILMAQK